MAVRQGGSFDADGTMSGGTWIIWTAIALGSAIGGVLRHAVAEVVIRLGGSGPTGTLVVNVIGSMAIGGCMAASSSLPGGWSPLARHAAMTGLLGGFTTFSTFSAQSLELLQQGHWQAAAANVLTSVVLGVLGCSAGYAAAAAALR
jgi:CrcB protein